jgi:hypothetical protein
MKKQKRGISFSKQILIGYALGKRKKKKCSEMCRQHMVCWAGPILCRAERKPLILSVVLLQTPKGGNLKKQHEKNWRLGKKN